MSELQILEGHRNTLHNNILDKSDDDALAVFRNSWPKAKLWIEDWWKAYENWEEKDTFNAAVADNRMTMRSFGSDFKTQVNKTIPVGITFGRFYDPNRQSLPDADHLGPYAAMKLAQHKRGIDTSAYAIPENFVSRLKKYEMGLHNLSVRLLTKTTNIKQHCHHMQEMNPHFIFLPLSKPQDQFVIYKLVGYAKPPNTNLQLHGVVREICAKMTRVKLASDYDMGTGYIAVPTPLRADGLAYSVTYSAGSTLKQRGALVPPKTTMDRLKARREMYFKHQADIVKYPTNELVIAMRRHKGPFPVYAVYEDRTPEGILNCFKIAGGTKEILTGKTITLNGRASW